MSHSLRAAILGSWLFFVGCGPSPVEIAPTSQTSNLTTTPSQTNEMSVTGFAYTYTYSRGNLYSLSCGSYFADVVATFSQFPARILVQNCLGPNGTLSSCEPLHVIECDLGTGACAAKNHDELTADRSVISMTQDSGGYTVRVASDVRFQACNSYVPTNVKLKIQALNSVTTSPWTEAGCSTSANPPLNHYQCH